MRSAAIFMFGAVVGALLVLAAWFLTPKAHADMCGPTPGIPLFPYIQSCHVWVPGVPTAGIPMPGPAANAPFPIPGVGGAGGWLGPRAPGSYYNPTPYTPPLP